MVQLDGKEKEIEERDERDEHVYFLGEIQRSWSKRSVSAKSMVILLALD